MSNSRCIYTELFNRHNSFNKIKNILAIILKFTKFKRCEDFVEILNYAEMLCIRWSQQQEFSHEIKSLKTSGSVNSSSKLHSLTPFLNTNGIMRVSGRVT